MKLIHKILFLILHLWLTGQALYASPDSVKIISTASQPVAASLMAYEYLPNNLLFDRIKSHKHNTATISQLIALGKEAYTKGVFDISISYFQDVLKLCNKGDEDWAFQATSGIAKCYTIQGDYRLAAKYFYQAISIAENVPEKAIKLANNYTNLSVIWNLLGDRQRSLDYLAKAEVFAIAEKDSTALGNIINKRGNILLYSDTTRAFQQYTKALRISEACSDLTTTAMATANLAYIHIVTNNFAEARTKLNRFGMLYQHKSFDTFHKLSMQYTYGLYSYLLHDYNVAENAWLNAVKQAEAINAPLYQVKPMEGLSLLYAQTGQYDKAYYYQQLHDSMNSNIVNEDKVKAVSALESKYQLVQKEKLLALNQLKVAEQNASLFKQNIIITACVLAAFMLVLFYIIIRRNIKRKLIIQQKQALVLSKQKELELIKNVMAGEERERKRMAFELHDSIGSMLSMAKLNLSVVRDQFTHQTEEDNFSELLSLIDRTSHAVRSTAHNLMPEILLQGGLDEGLQIYCDKMSKAKGIAVKYQCYGQAINMDIEKEKMLFRVLQETLMLIAAYTKATQLSLQLNWQTDLLFVTIDSNNAPELATALTDDEIKEWELLQQRIKAADGILYTESLVNQNTTFDLEFSF